jgi:polyphosphate kinase
MSPAAPTRPAVDAPEAFFDRDLSWLAFARRVLALVGDPELPLLERLKFAGIMGTLHDEFFMKRMSGLKRRIHRRARPKSFAGLSNAELLAACREEILDQVELLDRSLRGELLPALAAENLPILGRDGWSVTQRQHLRDYFRRSVQPILTPLAVDREHPFPFISNDALNLAVMVPVEGAPDRFVRVKVPDNRPRWVALPEGAGYAPLEQVIAANLDLMFPETPPSAVWFFRVTRGVEGDIEQTMPSEEELSRPGGIIRLVASELKARRFAGVVRLQVDCEMPDEMVGWIARQLQVGDEDLYRCKSLLGVCDLLDLDPPDRDELRLPRHEPATHPRLADLPADEPAAIFDEIKRADLLVHHPYQSFDSSVLRFIEAAAADPDVLAIKLTIYRTSKGSPIVRALTEAARRGKQVAVLVEITARFDEAPNIAWGEYLENEGVHVAYGVEKLKTHVKLALVVREERGRIRRYAHIGTGNYHTGTARIYEDLGLLTGDHEICAEVAAVFDQLTGATPPGHYRHLLVAPTLMRGPFLEMIRREAENAARGRPAGIDAKMNQLQDREVIGALYRASRAGVPIRLLVRGLCCLRPGVPGLSESIRVTSVLGRFLEHSRIYRFENAGSPRYFLGSADWMHRNLSNRVETITPVVDPEVQRQLEEILEVYRNDNCSAWDCGPDGVYVRRVPAAGEERRAAQTILIRRAEESPGRAPSRRPAAVAAPADP